MAENLRVFGTNFNTVNALKVTSQAEGYPQLIYTTGSGQILLQTKTVTPATASQSVRPDEGYFGLAQVNVNAIPYSYVIPSGTYSITRNGEYNVATYAAASVNIVFVPNNQAKSATPTSTQQVITADNGYDGLSSVTISAVSLQNKTVNPGLSNSTVTADAGYNGLGTVTITPNLQTKNITPTKSSQNITPDNGYGGLSEVTINPIPSNYIDTTDATATENDILQGQTAYVNTQKITGTLAISRLYEGVEAPSNNMGNIGDMYIQVG